MDNFPLVFESFPLLNNRMETAYIECKRLETKIQKHNAQLKEMRTKLQSKKAELYNQMKARKKTEYKEYTLEQLAPKPKIDYKAIREKKDASIKGLLHSSGVNDAANLLVQIKEIQRPKAKGKGK